MARRVYPIYCSQIHNTQLLSNYTSIRTAVIFVGVALEFYLRVTKIFLCFNLGLDGCGLLKLLLVVAAREGRVASYLRPVGGVRGPLGVHARVQESWYHPLLRCYL